MSLAADYVVPEQHDAILRNMCRIEVGPELPVELKEAYLRRRMLADRGGLRISESDLIDIAIDYGHDLPDVNRQQSFLEVIKDNTVPLGSNVKVKWRYGKWFDGKYQGTKNEKVLVLVDDGTAEVRQFNPDNVKLA